MEAARGRASSKGVISVAELTKLLLEDHEEKDLANLLADMMKLLQKGN